MAINLVRASEWWAVLVRVPLDSSRLEEEPVDNEWQLGNNF